MATGQIHILLVDYFFRVSVAQLVGTLFVLSVNDDAHILSNVWFSGRRAQGVRVSDRQMGHLYNRRTRREHPCVGPSEHGSFRKDCARTRVDAWADVDGSADGADRA